MTGLIGWWPLHETEGDTAYDLSGNGNHGSLNGDPVTGVAGRSGLTSYSFDGSDDYVRVDHDTRNDVDGSDTWTAAAWIKTTETGGDTTYGKCFFERRNVDTDSEWVFHIGPDSEGNTRLLVGFPDDSNRYTLLGEKKINDGNWHHVLVLREGTKIEIHVDGVKDAERQIDIRPEGIRTNIGARSTDQGSYTDHSEASITDFRIYNRTLTPSEIKELYRQGSQDFHKKSLSDGSDMGAVSRWKLKDGGSDGSTAVDSWGGDDGTINGASFTDDSVRNDGRALQFDGESDYVNEDSGNLSIDDQSWSLGMWVKVEDYPDSRAYVFSTDSPNLNFDIAGDSGAGSGDSITVYDGESWYGLDSGKYVSPDGEWKHLVFVFDHEANVYTVYVNGSVLDSADVGDGVFDWDSSGDGMTLMSRESGGAHHIEGCLSDVRIYDRVLEPWEVFELYRWGSLGKDMRKELVNKRGGGQ